MAIATTLTNNARRGARTGATAARKAASSAATGARRVAQTSYRAGAVVGGLTTAAGSRARTRTSKTPIVIAGAAGAAGAYFLDPDSGNRRRAVARDRVAAFFRRRGREASRAARTTAQQVTHGAQGVVAETTPSAPKDLNDPALKSKVESEIFRPADAPKGDVNVNVENGVVYLRGEVKTSDQIEELVEAAGAVDGVEGVENLLHTPGTDAPTKGNGAKASKPRTRSGSRARKKTT